MNIQYGDFLETEIDLPFSPEIPLLRIYSKKMKSSYSRSTCIPMFITVQFTIAKTRKQPRYPSTNETIMKVWHIYSKMDPDGNH